MEPSKLNNQNLCGNSGIFCFFVFQNCPGGHGLERAKVEAEGFSCDLCQNSIRGGTFIYSCDDCEYDVCHDCVEGNSTLSY